MFGFFKRREAKEIRELKEIIEEQAGNIGKLSYEMQSLRNRYNKQLGSVAKKLQDVEEAPIASGRRGRWDSWKNQFSVEEQGFLAGASPDEIAALRSMVEEGSL